jgi:ribosomal protein L16/L10AE
MFLNSKIRFKKPHLVWLKSYKVAQYIISQQKKTFDHIFLKSLISTNVNAKEYEALRRILSRKLLRLLRFSLKSRPVFFVTKKPKEMRMGKGKGAFSHFTFFVKCGLPFVKLSWCHKQYYPHFFYALQTAVKKTALKCRY